MAEAERVEALVLGSGEGGKYLAWHLAQSGRRTAVVERRWIGGSCPNINCLPSKNEIWSRKGGRSNAAWRPLRRDDGLKHGRYGESP
jgi:choline dehydrogenase-like flavoprotein